MAVTTKHYETFFSIDIDMFFAFTVPSVRGPFSCRTKSALVVKG